MKKPHILLTTDLSPDSMRAIGPAVDLARKIGAKITLLNVLLEIVTVPHGYPYVPICGLPDAAELIANAKQSLAKLRDEIGGDLEIEVEVIVGGTVESTICTYAAEHDVDLIAMSTHGRSGLRRLLMGSVAESVLRSATVPVLAVPG